MNASARLEARSVGHRFGPLRVLDRVGFALPAGKLGVVLGPNGAGKTTLLRALAGVLTPESGSILLDGVPVRELARREVARCVAVVPQDAAVLFPFRVREIVAMARAPHLGPLGREGPSDRAAIDAALCAMGLDRFEGRLFPTLSGGERQRVLLARALAQGTSLLLLDEPTAHMDLGHRLFVFESLRGWIAEAPERRAALAVTHDLGLAAAFADLTVLLHRGRIVASGTPEEVLEAQRIESVYDADVEVRPGSGGRPVVVAVGSRIRYPARRDG